MNNNFTEIQKKVLAEYPIVFKKIVDYKYIPNDPDMWAHYFSSDGEDYILVEYDYFLDINDVDEHGEIVELCRKLTIEKRSLKLIKPTLEQIHTEHNQYGLGIDGFDPIIDKDTGIKYKNPHSIHENVVYTLFKIAR